MTARLARTTAVLALAATSAASRAGFDLELRNGDKVSATISSGADVEIVRFRVPKGALVSVKGMAAKKGPQIRLALKDPADSPVASAEGRVAAIAKQTALASGLYSVEVTSADGVSTGDYALAVSWKSPASFGGKFTVPTAGTQVVAFSADAGATATFRVAAAPRSAAAPTLVEWTRTDATIEALTGTSQKRGVAVTGDGDLTVASTAGGDVVAAVKVKPPAASKRKYALTTTTIGTGNFVVSKIVGPGGGTVAAPFVDADQPGAALDGASVSVPAGALPSATSIVIATAPDIAATAARVGAGPTVYFGPEGLRFDAADKTISAQVTIPFDAAFAASTERILIYTRNAKGVVTAVAKPYTFDVAAGTVSFATSHFSSFRAMWQTPSLDPNNFRTIANLGYPWDICAAYDTSGASPPVALFVAEAAIPAVMALRLTDASTQTYTMETWAGGGTETATPADRTQFQFSSDDTLNAVVATTDGVVYAATSTRIYRIDQATGTVTIFAGTGAAGDTGDGGPPLQATFKSITDIVVAGNGDLFVADGGAVRIRLIRMSPAPEISAWAGNGLQAIGADGGDVATTSFFSLRNMSIAPAGGLYVADFRRIRRIDLAANVNVTVAGDPAGLQSGSTGDGGPPSAATFMDAEAISPFRDPLNPADDLLLVSDSPDSTIRLLNFTKGTVRLFAGAHGTAGYSGDVGSTPGLLYLPNSIVAVPGVVYVADRGNLKIRAITNPQ